MQEDSELNSHKHSLYQKTVQNPKREIGFYKKVFRKIYGRIPLTFREDFCGTGLLSCEWVKSNVENTAVGIDIDTDTILWGIENNVKNLSSGSDRVLLISQNVLTEYDENAKFDVICSMNYSHYLLNKRTELLKYFQNVRRNISKGIFVMDFFGGDHLYRSHMHTNSSDFYKFSGEQMNIVDNTTIVKLTYRTEENTFEPLFTYKFRVYSLIEIREALEDAGFTKFKIFIKDVSDEDEENIYKEYQEIDINEDYFSKMERYNGYFISYI